MLVDEKTGEIIAVEQQQLAKFLTRPEQQELAECEEIIGQGMRTFVEVGLAFRTIKESKLYREFGTFEDYCNEKWGMSRIHAHRLTTASTAYENLLPIGNILPTHETQIRPLTRLKESDLQVHAWKRSLEVAQTCNQEQPTEKQVKAIVDEMLAKPGEEIFDGIAGTFHLVHGDMFDVPIPMDIDLAITDFPYNISGQGKFTKLGSEAASFDAGDWDEDFDTAAAIELLAVHLKPGGALVFFADRLTISWSWEFCTSIGLEPKAIIVWHKTNPVPNARRNFMSATEFVLWATRPGGEYTWNGDATTQNIFSCGLCQGKERIEWTDERGEATRHPTQKPKAFLAWLIKLFSNPGDTVLDPCAGVGSIGACGLDREYYLIEKNSVYFERMKGRLGSGTN